MKLAIFNGSPRNKKSNSKILMEHFLSGYLRINQEKVPVQYLASRKSRDENLQVFKSADTVIIIFPLYTDCMPGIVKEFFEDLAILDFPRPKKIGFIVQSGFPEAIHSTFVERYLKKLTNRLDCEYLGTVIRGGVEGIQMMPSSWTKKLFNRFRLLGETFARSQTFSEEIKMSLAKPYKLPAFRRFMMVLLSKTRLGNFYWISNLKKNNAYTKRFDKPFLENSNISNTF